MRNLLLWGTAVLFLLVALYTVSVRRELYAEARRIGVLEEQLLEKRRRNDNLVLDRERLISPGAVRVRARQNGILEESR